MNTWNDYLRVFDAWLKAGMDDAPTAITELKSATAAEVADKPWLAMRPPTVYSTIRLLEDIQKVKPQGKRWVA